MPEMEHNGVWNHPQDDPHISSAPVRFNSTAFADIPTRANDHPSFSFSSGYPACFAANPGTSNSSFMNSAPNQAPNWPCYNQPIRGDGYTTIYPQMDYGRAAFKRKNPVMPPTADRANTTVYYQAGSSFNCPLYPVSLEPNMSPSPVCWPLHNINMPSSDRSDNNIAGEGLQRNVRSRHGEEFHSQFNAAWFYTSRDMPYVFCSTSNTSDPRMTELCNHFPPPMVPQGQLPASDGPCGSIYSATTASASDSAYLSHVNQNRNQSSPLPALQCPSTRIMVPAQSGHSHRVNPYNTMSIYSGTGVSVTSDIGVPVGVEAAAPSRYLRPPPIIGHTTIHGENRNARDAHQRSRWLFNGHNALSRWVPEGALITDWSPFYDSANILDQHREMRMDIDNMSYEELLALGDRIGNVSTGLSDETVSRCMKESVYYSSRQIQEEGKCAICLEEYENSEKTGRLNCGHDFHVCCISQWLRMKNVCPICREPAFSDAPKGAMISL